MVLDALEIGVVVLMAIGVLVWGPEKVPEIARTIGNARKQLDTYTKQLSGLSKELQTSMNTGNFDNLGNILTGASAGPISGNPTPEEIAAATRGLGAPTVVPSGAVGAGGAPVAVAATAATAAATSPLSPPTVKSGDELLLEMAKQLRIPTHGKTRDEIQKEILLRASTPVESRAGEKAAASTVAEDAGTKPASAPSQAGPDTPTSPQASAAAA